MLLSVVSFFHSSKLVQENCKFQVWFLHQCLPCIIKHTDKLGYVRIQCVPQFSTDTRLYNNKVNRSHKLENWLSYIDEEYTLQSLGFQWLSRSFHRMLRRSGRSYGTPPGRSVTNRTIKTTAIPWMELSSDWTIKRSTELRISLWEETTKIEIPEEADFCATFNLS